MRALKRTTHSLSLSFTTTKAKRSAIPSLSQEVVFISVDVIKHNEACLTNFHTILQNITYAMSKQFAHSLVSPVQNSSAVM